MNRDYSEKDQKDKFMTERLLPYMLDCIDTCKDSKVATVEKVASMCIFPYKTKTGIRISSLKESGISWYYVKGENKETISSESYRIFADNVVKPDLATRFRQIFHEYGYVSEFSDKVIIDEHIKKMSREKDYTFLWWNCAYSVLKLWNEGDLLHDFCQATRNIQNNKFLFLQNQFDQKLKDELIQLGIFSDIKDPVSMKLFWEKLSDKEYEKARKILKKMGVPCTCLEQDNTNIVNKYILDFVKTIKQQVNFPVYQAEAGYRQCELCHELFMNWIFKESPNAFKNVVEDPEYCSGIVVQNIDGAFVPLSWSLFYSEKELGENKDPDSQEECEALVETPEWCEKFEKLHINVKKYKEILGDLENVFEFSEVTMKAEEYQLGDDCDPIEFYRWVWKYSKHTELAERILWYYSGDKYNRETVSGETAEFVLSVLEKLNDAETTVGEYSFDIDIDSEIAFKNNIVLNEIRRRYKNIYGVVYGDFVKLNFDDLKERIRTSDSIEDEEVKRELLMDSIWNHIYGVKANNKDCGEDIYVRGWKYENNSYEEVLLLWSANDSDLSYFCALENYIYNAYNINIQYVDWKVEYSELINGVRKFLDENLKKRSPNDFCYNTVNLEDISNLGVEKNVWNRLKEQKRRIISQKIYYEDQNYTGNFLRNKYHGRCQLCHEKIYMSDINAYSWTFRMVKMSKNKLADFESNLFCLCPSCHGEMRYGNYMGKDLLEIVNKAKWYANAIEEKIKDEHASVPEDYCNEKLDCLIGKLAEKKYAEFDGFYNPIVCNVIVNGKERKMVFSWEHFMRIAFVFSKVND